MKVLALDTALFGCAVGVYDPDTAIAKAAQESMTRGQAERLVPMVKEVIADAGLMFSDIDLIATTIGPGAFTGLRIGLSTAQSFGLALDIPVAGVTTLEVLAAQFFAGHSLEKSEYLLVLIETKREDYYCQLFDTDEQPASAPQALALSAVHQMIEGKAVKVIGDALDRFGAASERTDIQSVLGFNLIDPVVMARLALEQHKAGAAQEARPLYLRDADVSVSKKIQRVILEE